MSTINFSAVTKEDVFAQLQHISQQPEFNNEFYPHIDKMVQAVAHLKKTGAIDDADMKRIQHFFGQDFLENTLHGMALLKKYGYAGDFMMIDRIYTGNRCNNSFFQSWDDYFQNHAAPRAVRNRKEFFKKLLQRKLAHNNSIQLLNVASGPSRDLLELYNSLNPGTQLKTTCVEMDNNAIVYSSELLKNYLQHIEFINRNIFKFDTEERFDVIWSAGLFDYFDDKAFVFILKKFKQWIKPHGEIVIGNFNSRHNPTRDYMELFGEWYLQHRSSEQLIALAIEAGFDENQVAVGCESEKVNLFLRINMG
jgi:extracellular factor (EF) 3-hydroxypalmitic acid methyl ester biosynthesis protein